MCGLCGCGTDTHEHQHQHQHEHEHEHHDIIQIEQDLLAKNNQFAAVNRNYFTQHQLTALNLMSSPGSGKTTLLSRTFEALKDKINIAIIVGDQQTDFDAKQLQSVGAQAIQVNTGNVCHLDAHMVGHSLDNLTLGTLDHSEPSDKLQNGVLFIENVGNLVCPSLFDLGEAFRIVLLSVTEGDNKPLKYPDMFRKADLIILTKMDLLPYVSFEPNKAIEYARRINPAIEYLSLSTKSGEGLDSWYQWLINATKK